MSSTEKVTGIVKIVDTKEKETSLKKRFFDTETTGLKPGQIGQLAYIDEYTDGEIKAGNYFFRVDYVTRGAEEVTGRGVEFYRDASKGKVFADCADEIAQGFSNSIIIAHNVDFDMGFLNIELFRADKCINNCKQFDTMKYFRDVCKIPNPRYRGTYKNPKLIELVEYLHIDKDKIGQYCNKLFIGSGESFHGAMYDTTAMFIAFKVYQEMLNNAGTFWRDTFVEK